MNPKDLEDLEQNPSDRDLFARVVKEACDHFDHRSLANSLSTSLTTIDRWKSGQAMPHPMGVKLLVKEIKSRLRRSS
jgi:DNA-binding transcriptional regulator YiaG